MFFLETFFIFNKKIDFFFTLFQNNTKITKTYFLQIHTISITNSNMDLDEIERD